MIFLDSNICIAAMNGDAQVASRLLQATGRIAVSTIVVGELRYGAENSAFPQANHQRIDAFTNAAFVIPWSQSAAAEYGRIRAQLKSAGALIGERDMLIAAAALAEQALLITNNLDEFERVPNLRVQDWLS